VRAGARDNGEFRVVLTDDEVLALATRAGVGWPSASPTVDVADSGALSAAVQRGVRSLIVRELLGVGGEDHLADPVDRVVGPLLGGTPILGIYPATDQLRYVSVGVATAYYQGDEAIWVSELITGAGVHYLKLKDPSDCRQAGRQLLQQAVETGWPGNPEALGSVPTILCGVGQPTETSVRVVAARRGELSAYQSSSTGSPVPVARVMGSPEEAIEYLLGDLGRPLPRID
jgi:hypothetical protein